MRKRRHEEIISVEAQDDRLTKREREDYERALRIISIYKYLQSKTNLIFCSRLEEQKFIYKEISEFQVLRIAATFLKNKHGIVCREKNLHTFLIDCEKGTGKMLQKLNRRDDLVIRSFLERL